MALRYVLDAQVLIAAFMQPTNRGARQLLRCGARGEFESIISTGILDELRMTLEGHRLVARHRRTQQISGYVDTLEEVFTITEQPTTIAGLARDEGDDFVATVVYTNKPTGSSPRTRPTSPASAPNTGLTSSRPASSSPSSATDYHVTASLMWPGTA